MSGKFQNKYRIKSTRCPNWDYCSNAAYFITICTKDREYYFGEISDNKMNVTEIGKRAEIYWYKIPEHFPFVKLDEFIVMPNHIHGIIIIDKPIVLDDVNVGDAIDDDAIALNDAIVETQNFASLPKPRPKPTQTPQPTKTPKPPKKNKFGPQSKNLASIIRGYKIGVKKYATMNGIDFAWQSRFHDHIIRNDKSFNRIQNYILNNPKNWTDDKFYN